MLVGKSLSASQMGQFGVLYIFNRTGKRRGKLGFGVCFALISTVSSSSEVSVYMD